VSLLNYKSQVNPWSSFTETDINIST